MLGFLDRQWGRGVALLLLASACVADEEGSGATDGSGSGDSSTGVVATMSTSGSPMTTAMPQTDSGSSDTTAAAEETTAATGDTTDAATDATTDGTTAASTDGTTDATTTEGTTGEANVHPGCTEPMPEPPPPLPNVNLDPSGVPEFALWQDYACDDPAVTQEIACGSDPRCPEDNCVDFGSGSGVCSYVDIDTTCDGEGAVMGTTDGSCWICLEPTQHAQACCTDPAGLLDCREWPFDDDPGTIGQVCATHEDCEPGLACSEPSYGFLENPTGVDCEVDGDCPSGVCGSLFWPFECIELEPHYAGYGICACPGTPSDAIVPAESCFD